MRTTIAILTRSTITLLPALFLFGANLASAAVIAEVTASAVSYGSDHVGPAIPTTTSTPGQIVHQSESANGRDANGNVVGSVTGTSSAATNFGVNRVGLTTALFGILTPETNAVAYVNAGTYSNWMDGWTITGRTAGDLVSVFVSGRTTYDLSLTGGAVADPGRLTLSQLFNASVLNGGGQISFDHSDFVANASAGFFDWQLNFDVHSGDQIQITSSLQAESDAGGAGLNLGLTSKTFAFDAMNTSLLRTISVPTAYTITSDSGELIAHDGAFAYRATIGSVPVPVPEPQSWLLITAGLAAITARRRRFAAGR